jgi:thiamine-phosphate pyrophosphorylase
MPQKGGLTPLSPFPSLYVIADAEVCARAGWTLVDFASACFDGGARLLQIRAKHLPGRDFLEATAAIVRRAEAFKALVIVNDRADIARLGQAAGVHVGQEDLSPAQARALVGADGLVGLSTHTPAQLESALQQNVNYVAVGPVFWTETKGTGYDPIGLETVRTAAALAADRGLPLVAIGGITLDRAPSVIQAGARSVAVISDLLVSRDPTRRVREYLSALM